MGTESWSVKETVPVPCPMCACVLGSPALAARTLCCCFPFLVQSGGVVGGGGGLPPTAPPPPGGWGLGLPRGQRQQTETRGPSLGPAPSLKRLCSHGRSLQVQGLLLG